MFLFDGAIFLEVLHRYESKKHGSDPKKSDDGSWSEIQLNVWFYGLRVQTARIINRIYHLISWWFQAQKPVGFLIAAFRPDFQPRLLAKSRQFRVRTVGLFHVPTIRVQFPVDLLVPDHPVGENPLLLSFSARCDVQSEYVAVVSVVEGTIRVVPLIRNPDDGVEVLLVGDRRQNFAVSGAYLFCLAHGNLFRVKGELSGRSENFCGAVWTHFVQKCLKIVCFFKQIKIKTLSQNYFRMYFQFSIFCFNFRKSLILK